MTTLRKFILSADWHLVQTCPVARLDPSWLETQRQAIRFLVSQAVKHSCPLVAVGDLFDHPKVGTEVVNMVLEELNTLRSQGQEFYLIAGNHDLEGNLATNAPKCSVGTLLNIFPRIPNIPGVQSAPHFGEDIDPDAPIVFTHQLVFKDESTRPPMAKGLTASGLLAKYPGAQWIFTGDHHSAWTYTESGRTVVNPGCMIVHNAGDIGHNGKCALIDLDSTDAPVTWIPIPDDQEMLTRDHLDTKAAKVDRLSGFMERVKEAGGHTLTFKDKLEARMGLKDITEPQAWAYRAIKTRATEVEK